MVECVRNGVSLGLFLQVVVSNLRCYVEAFLYVAILQGVEHPVVVVCPDAGKVVGLQLQADTDAVTFLFADTAHLLVGTVQYT